MGFFYALKIGIVFVLGYKKLNSKNYEKIIDDVFCIIYIKRLFTI